MAKKLVIVEDDADTVEIIRAALKSHDLKILAAEDGCAGLDLIQKQRPDAAIIDIQLPRMNGYEVCARIQSDEDLSAMPIMILTGLTNGNGPDDDAQWRERLQVADFVSKPFDPADLADRVTKMVS